MAAIPFARGDPSFSGSRFGPFELNFEKGQLFRFGIPIRLQPQSFKVLTLLVARRGEVVTREEIQQQIWGSHLIVDSEQGLNFCIRRIRTALGDSYETPRYIETVPRRGYRFIAPLQVLGRPLPPEETSPNLLSRFRLRARARRFRIIALAVAAVLLVAAYLLWGRFGQQGKALPETIRLAVLPFVNMSDSPEQEYFADGMTEALITALSEIESLRVISRMSVMPYKGAQQPLPVIARELGVQILVEGSVLRAEGRVRITAQLIDAAKDENLWAQDYERDLRDVLALQSEVAQTIAQQVRIELTPGEHARLASVRPVNPQAYEAYFKGRSPASFGFPQGMTTLEAEIGEGNPRNACIGPCALLTGMR